LPIRKIRTVHGFRGSRLDFCPRTAFIIRIYEKKVIFGRSNPKFGAKRAVAQEAVFVTRTSDI